MKYNKQDWFYGLRVHIHPKYHPNQATLKNTPPAEPFQPPNQSHCHLKDNLCSGLSSIIRKKKRFRFYSYGSVLKKAIFFCLTASKNEGRKAKNEGKKAKNEVLPSFFATFVFRVCF